MPSSKTIPPNKTLGDFGETLSWIGSGHATSDPGALGSGYTARKLARHTFLSGHTDVLFLDSEFCGLDILEKWVGERLRGRE
ncbi:hypothetical protein BP5796_00248 [Coleophoma crateriformis]|uniref:Uncharacterized protein n=1 Tax=Coleophoma crateriformis TaxID=565419 RepID=A0A3D8T7H7_9HELO|nr:hypothetical protein BP5796_00248 [Coleophoma crateriformis]